MARRGSSGACRPPSRRSGERSPRPSPCPCPRRPPGGRARPPARPSPRRTARCRRPPPARAARRRARRNRAIRNAVAPELVEDAAQPPSRRPVVSLEEGGGGVTDRVEVYHLDPELRADRGLLAGQPALPVGALRVGRGNERPQHRRGRPRGEVNVVDVADRVDERCPIGLRQERRVLPRDPVVGRDVAEHRPPEGGGRLEVGDVARVQRVEASVDHRHARRGRPARSSVATIIW